jgi:hypothetical protein
MSAIDQILFNTANKKPRLHPENGVDVLLNASCWLLPQALNTFYAFPESGSFRTMVTSYKQEK